MGFKKKNSLSLCQFMTFPIWSHKEHLALEICDFAIRLSRWDERSA